MRVPSCPTWTGGLPRLARGHRDRPPLDLDWLGAMRTRSATAPTSSAPWSAPSSRAYAPQPATLHAALAIASNRRRRWSPATLDDRSPRRCRVLVHLLKAPRETEKHSRREPRAGAPRLWCMLMPAVDSRTLRYSGRLCGKDRGHRSDRYRRAG